MIYAASSSFLMERKHFTNTNLPDIVSVKYRLKSKNPMFIYWNKVILLSKKSQTNCNLFPFVETSTQGLQKGILRMTPKYYYCNLSPIFFCRYLHQGLEKGILQITPSLIFLPQFFFYYVFVLCIIISKITTVIVRS